ncbi:hypothetical protein [Hydrocarboniclastica marina]|uniref:Uncharacterized protein n=1 Tax=Hydrocarboniclastica marina TaxID=2259620 RepID=A0A4P7XMB9_9ALTE|nr:hypothetical protein [Hydrocarboniclastica marina]QCF27207.1 hypothetical protein soil367_15425 [Hydrocarboniclastica marina]
MMSDGDAIGTKVFLLSCGQYTTKKNFITALFSLINRSDQNAEHVRLDGDRVLYDETSGSVTLSTLNAATAIDMARHYSMFVIPGFRKEVSFGQGDNGPVQRVESNLFYDEDGCFLVVTEVDMAFAPDSDSESICKYVLARREVFANLGLVDYMEGIFRQAEAAVHEVVSAREKKFPKDGVRFSQECTLPLLVSEAEMSNGVLERFRNEESLKSISCREGIDSEYPEAFFHPGWNYTVALNLPPQVCLNLLQIMIRCQCLFFCLGYFKTYFQDEFRIASDRRHIMGHREVEEADRVRLAFHDLSARYFAFQNKLFPKYHDEAVRLLQRWHCYDDLENIEKYIDLNFQAKERLHNTNLERQNEKQNYALALIAVFQVLAIFGALSDGVSVLSFSQEVFWAGTALCIGSIAAFFILSRYTVSLFVFLGVSLAVAGYLFI